MTHGAPDWGSTSTLTFMHRVYDMAELAARLGSSNVFDRRGNVLLMDGFESGFSGWEEEHTAGDGWIQPIAFPTHIGGVAIGCQYSSAAGAVGRIFRYVAMPQITSYGLEAAFLPALNNRYFEELLDVYDGTQVWYYGFRWYQQTGELKVCNASFEWETFATIRPLVFSGYPWFIAKLVVDLDNHAYKRVMINAQTFDVTSFAPYHAAADMSAIIYIGIAGANDIAVSDLAAFDDVILTMNE